MSRRLCSVCGDLVKRYVWRDFDTCYACTTLIRCEVPSCNEWCQTIYTTCKKHTALLRAVGVEPALLMGSGLDRSRLKGPMTTEQLDTLDKNDIIPLHRDFRFSASYASRYHKCHGSARLDQAIEGFEYPERNDNGMKGQGTKRHKIFEVALSSPETLRESASLLRWIADVRGTARIQLLQDKKNYIIQWFLKTKTAPPLDAELLFEGLVNEIEVLDTSANVIDTRLKSVEPRFILFLAEALEYVADLIDEMEDDYTLLVEEKREADWLTTRPKTTADVILYDSKRFLVLDLKAGEIPVDATNNTQLMYYAWTMGARDYSDAELHIMQRNNFNSWIVSHERLEQWSEDMLDSERAILAGDLTLTPGAHCTFCPANPHGRGDKGNKACPVQLSMLYGERDVQVEEEAVLEGDWNE